MTTRKEDFTSEEYYHIYNRGNSKQNIFLDNDDYDRFTKLLYLCNSSKSFNFRDDIIDRKIDAYDFKRNKKLVSIGAWVNMSNHFHILLSPRGTLGENVSIFMNKISTSYSMYFNRKYKRTGKLFEGTFKAVRISSDPQLKYNFSYLHLNPLKIMDANWKEKGIKNHRQALIFLDKYPWSSYYEYLGKMRPENKIISREDFPDYFSDPNIFKREIFEWLTYSKE